MAESIFAPRLGRYAQPTAARFDFDWARCLALMLDEVDYGLLLLDEAGTVCLLNQRARLELDGLHPLAIDGGRLRARRRTDTQALSDALAAAPRGVRRLLALGDGERRISVAVVPLGIDVLDGGPATMLLLEKRQVGEDLSVRAFARANRITPAETQVLEYLCAGLQPREIAERQGVRISTVRTQIGCLREKTGAGSIRELVRRVSVLPPMVPALRSGAATPFGALLEGMLQRP